MPTKPLIAVVDDDESVRIALRSLMRAVGFAAEAFVSAEEFLAFGGRPRAACLILDMNMPRMTGLELHQRLSASGEAIPIILITAYPDEGARERALAAGFVGYLSKPFEEVDLLACIRSALAHASGAGSEGR